MATLRVQALLTLPSAVAFESTSIAVPLLGTPRDKEARESTESAPQGLHAMEGSCTGPGGGGERKREREKESKRAHSR